MEDPFIGRFDKIPFLVNSSKMDLLIQWSFLSDVDKMKSPSTSLSSQSTFIAILSQADPGPATPIRIFFFFLISNSNQISYTNLRHQSVPSAFVTTAMATTSGREEAVLAIVTTRTTQNPKLPKSGWHHQSRWCWPMCIPHC